MPWCRGQCVLHCAFLCSEKICVASRPVPSWKQKYTAPCRREKRKYRQFLLWWKKLYTVRFHPEKLWPPSRPVEVKSIYRPVPSWQLYFPSRPVVTIFNHRPVPSWNEKVIVLYRPVPSRKFTARPVFIFVPAKHVKTAPSCILPAMKSLGFFP